MFTSEMGLFTRSLGPYSLGPHPLSPVVFSQAIGRTVLEVIVQFLFGGNFRIQFGLVPGYQKLVKMYCSLPFLGNFDFLYFVPLYYTFSNSARFLAESGTPSVV